MATSEPQRYLAGVLRYFASAVVGVSLVWVFDEKHDIIGIVFSQAWPNAWPLNVASSSWTLLGLLGVVGILTYFVHRIAFHWLVTAAILFFLRRRDPSVPSARKLDFARWKRRGASESSPERSIQSALDEVNAAAHFLYCSAWASLLVAGFLFRADRTDLNLMRGFVPTVLAFLLLGIIADVRAACYDVEAYKQFESRDAAQERLE